MTVERFQPEHVAEIVAGESERATELASASPAAYTLRYDGIALLCGGVADLGSGRGLLWSYVSPLALGHPILIHRSVLRFLSTLDFRRIEATCVCGSVRANKWLERLGFTREGTMRAWAPDGTDHELYALVAG